MPAVKPGFRAPLRSANLGGRFERGAIRIAEEHFAGAANFEVVHGEKHLNVSNIARFWNAYLETRGNVNAPLNKFEVCLMMTLLKIARTQSGTNNADDLLDAIGYLAMAHEMRP